MAYTAELMQLIKKVEKTRPERVTRKKAGEEFPALSLDERAERLEAYHPDYRSGGLRELKVGPSKGYALAKEFADVLEAKSRVDPDKIDLNEVHYTTDVLVIGGGGAGTAAALLAQEQGARVIIATKLRHGDANTMMAEGGIQAATKGWKDSPYYHYLDVMGGGHFENDPELVRTMVTEAPKVIGWLEGLGCLLGKNADGTLFTLHGAGTCRKRMHYAGDMTGAEIMRTIRDEARNRVKDIGVLEFSPAVELLTDSSGGRIRRGLVQPGDRRILHRQGQGGRNGHRWLRPAAHSGFHDHEPLRCDGRRSGSRVPLRSRGTLPPCNTVPPHWRNIPRTGRGAAHH